MLSSEDFVDRTEPFRRELLAHCYRMLGSVDEAEVAHMLDTTPAAVKSTLQRARSRLPAVAAAAEEAGEPGSPQVRSLLDQYVFAFEQADAAALERALRKDAILEMVPSLTWFAGVDTCLRYISQFLGAPGDWQMVPTVANGQPAAAAYRRAPDGTHRAFGLAILTVTDTGIARITLFGKAELTTRFGFPPIHPPVHPEGRSRASS